MFRYLLTLFLGKKYSKYLINNKKSIESISKSSPLAATLVENTFKLLLFWRFLVFLWYGFVIVVISSFVIGVIYFTFKFFS